MKLITLLTLLFISLSSQASVPHGALSGEIKRETELKLNLTKEGFRHLENLFLKELKGERSKRDDYYFEIWDGENYLLKKISPPIKLRFMWDGLDLKWQTQKTEKNWAYSIFTFKETLAESSTFKGHDLLKYIERYHDLLAKLDKKALDEAQSIQEKLHEMGIISSLSSLCSLCSDEKNYFSSHLNQKVRAKVKLTLEGDQFALQVGETDNHGLTSYELEAEVKRTTDLKLSADKLKNWLTQKGLTQNHIESSDSPDPTLKSEENLRRLLH